MRRISTQREDLAYKKEMESAVRDVSVQLPDSIAGETCAKTDDHLILLNRFSSDDVATFASAIKSIECHDEASYVPPPPAMLVDLLDLLQEGFAQILAPDDAIKLILACDP